MKEAYNKLVYKEVPMPPAPGEVLIAVKAAGICGSDVHGMDGSTGRRIPPLIMGHEAAGIIHSVGDNVSDWEPGDRVTFDSTIYRLDDWYTRKGFYNLSDNRMVLGVSCAEFKKDGAFAEFVTVPSHILYKLPDNVSFEHAAMVEPIAVALHALSLTDITLNDTVVVGGAGMIALFVIQLLKLSGCGKIIAFDIDQSRLDLAVKLGATHVFNAEKVNVAEEVKKLTGGRGADIGIEVVGISPVLKTVIESVRKGGQVTLVGNLSPEVNLPLQQVVTRQLKLQGSCAIAGEYEQALDINKQRKGTNRPASERCCPFEGRSRVVQPFAQS
jgi:L-iditol 2-dehydrogenase